MTDEKYIMETILPQIIVVVGWILVSLIWLGILWSLWDSNFFDDMTDKVLSRNRRLKSIKNTFIILLQGLLLGFIILPVTFSLGINIVVETFVLIKCLLMTSFMGK